MNTIKTCDIKRATHNIKATTRFGDLPLETLWVDGLVQGDLVVASEQLAVVDTLPEERGEHNNKHKLPVDEI